MCVSLRHGLDTKQAQSPNLQVHGELIWSKVSPNRAFSLGFIWTHYSKEVPHIPARREAKDEGSE
jgi:hypothetical protein